MGCAYAFDWEVGIPQGLLNATIGTLEPKRLDCGQGRMGVGGTLQTAVSSASHVGQQRRSTYRGGHVGQIRGGPVESESEKQVWLAYALLHSEQ